jgi:hypothetical protein
MELGKVGLNVNGDASEDIIADRSSIANKLGIPVWIGELDFLNPFETAEIVAEHSSTPIAIFCSPSRRACDEIKSRLIRLRNRFDNDFILALVPGKSRKISSVIECLRRLKEKLDSRIFVGCSGEKLTTVASKLADGLVLNYCDLKAIGRFTACYSVSLVLPSEHYDELLLASAVTLSRRLKLSVDFEYIVRNRGRLEIPKEIAENAKLLEAYTISGSIEDIAEKISEALSLCDHVILGVPFFRDERSMKSLKAIIDMVERG